LPLDLLFCANGKEVVPFGWDGVGLSGALRIDSPPIYSSKGVNTSALYGFTQTLLEILKNQEPTHIAVALIPMPQHNGTLISPITRPRAKQCLKISSMPSPMSAACWMLPNPVLTCDGYEADDIIGTLVAARRERRIQILHGYAG